MCCPWGDVLYLCCNNNLLGVTKNRDSSLPKRQKLIEIYQCTSFLAQRGSAPTLVVNATICSVWSTGSDRNSYSPPNVWLWEPKFGKVTLPWAGNETRWFYFDWIFFLSIDEFWFCCHCRLLQLNTFTVFRYHMYNRSVSRLIVQLENLCTAINMCIRTDVSTFCKLEKVTRRGPVPAHVDNVEFLRGDAFVAKRILF